MSGNNSGNFWKTVAILIAIGAIIVCCRQGSIEPVREWIDMPAGDKIGEAFNWLLVGGVALGVVLLIAAIFRRR